MGREERSRGRPADRSKSAELRDSTVSGSVVQAGEIQGGVHFHAAEQRSVRPRELPPPPAHFTGREAELAALDRFAGESPASDGPLITVVIGPGGTGKTALLSHWLHRRRTDYPDGRLYVDLHGFSPLEATPPSEVLGRFLRALGVEPEKIPAEFEERSTLFRTLTSGRRIAILADNAVSAAQVRALLPGPGASLVAVTSRRSIRGLLHEGARFLDLHPLDEDDAVDLLEKLIGRDRAQADPDAARTLTDQCGRLPIAIRALATRLAARRFLTLDRLAQELSDERRRIAALSPSEDITVRSIFDLSYAALAPDVATLYRRLGLLPVPTFTPEIVTTLMDQEAEACVPLVEELLNVSLIEEVADARFRLHDLIRLHAAEKAEEVDPPEDRTNRLGRIITWYLNAAALADRAVLPGRERMGPAAEAAGRAPPRFTTTRDALDWLETELPNLLAVLRAAGQAGFHEDAWQICEALWGLFVSRRMYPEWVAADELGLASARACGDHPAQARMLAQLGVALVDLRRLDDAERALAESLELARASGYESGVTSALIRLGRVRLTAGHPDDAIPYFTQARARHTEAGSPRGVALVTLRLAEAHLAAGDHPAALTHFHDAIDRFTAINDLYNIGQSSLGLARTHISAGDPHNALAPLDQAQQVARTEGSAVGEADAHILRADAHESLGDRPAARTELQHALRLLEPTGSPQTDNVRARLRDLTGYDQT